MSTSYSWESKGRYGPIRLHIEHVGVQLVYAFLEDAVLSLRKEENNLETISYFQVK